MKTIIYPWLFVALDGGLLLLTAVFLANISGDRDGTPSISVDQQDRLRLYQVWRDPVDWHEVPNTGDGSLRFKEQPSIEVVEEC